MQKDCSVIREEYAEAAGGLEIGQHQEHGSPPNSETVDQRRKRCRGASRPIPHKRNPASIKKRSTNSAEQTQKQDDHHAHTCIGSDTNRQFLSLLLTINSPAFCVCFLCGGVLVCGIALCPNYTHTSLSCSCVCVCTQTQPKTSLAQNPAV
jgi:hypothetical protein